MEPIKHLERDAETEQLWPGATRDGAKERRVGVEIEFTGLDAERAAAVVQQLYGGEIHAESRHRMRVKGGELGDFTVELDLAYAHGDDAEDSTSWLSRRLRDFAGEMATGILPMEVVCPPIPLSQCQKLDRLTNELYRRGARGGRSGVFVAVGAQLNPEAPSLEADSLLAHLRAFALLEDWLFDEINVEVGRQVLGFASPFPKPYLRKILAPYYNPTLPDLIDDYLEHNPTRNRALDLLPLFRHLDERRVVEALPNEKVKARPTFHYRLPNSNLDDSNWSLRREWARWRVVERLAATPAVIEITAREWLKEDWSIVSSWKTASRVLAGTYIATPEGGEDW